MIKTLLKFIFAGGIIFWLVKQGKLDFSLVSKVLSTPKILITCLVLVVSQSLLGAFRWKVLAQIQSKKSLTFLSIIRLTWIGLFFNSVLPGAVTGDLIKLVYAKDLDRSLSKTFLVMSVFMDRVIGLIGLLFLLGVFSIFTYEDIKIFAPQMTNLIHFNFLLFIGVIFFFISLFLPKKIQDILLNATSKLPILSERIHKVLFEVWTIGRDKKAVITCLVISLVAQTFNVLAFWIISSPFYDVALSFPMAFTFMPIGFMAIAVPITPAGLGVGHAIFNALFSYFKINNGASLFNLYFLCIVGINLLGVFPYLLSGKKHSLKEADEEFKELEV